jgi:hypothetical protein
MPRASTWRDASLAVFVSVAVEADQLYKAPRSIRSA